MNIFKKLLISEVIALGFTSFGGIANAACGKVVIASQNWASAELMAEVDKVCLLYTSPSPRDLSTSRMPSSA